MMDEIQLIKDGDGLAVFGREAALERFLRASGLWAASKEVDLRRLRAAVAVGSEVVTEGTEFASHAGRWVKLTEESARRVQCVDETTPSSLTQPTVPGAKRQGGDVRVPH